MYTINIIDIDEHERVTTLQFNSTVTPYQTDMIVRETLEGARFYYENKLNDDEILLDIIVEFLDKFEAISNISILDVDDYII